MGDGGSCFLHAVNHFAYAIAFVFKTPDQRFVGEKKSNSFWGALVFLRQLHPHHP
jgi:hypothetical protein